MSSKRFLAITGIVGGGKSTLCLRLNQDYGFKVLSMDVLVSRAFVQPDVRKLLKSAFGLWEVPRSALRKVILQGSDPEYGLDQEFRKEYLGLMNAHVQQFFAQDQSQFVEYPLLFELGAHQQFEHVWCVGCPRDIQLQRLTKRLGSIEEANMFINSQKSLEYKVKRSELYIDTAQFPDFKPAHNQLAAWGFTARTGQN